MVPEHVVGVVPFKIPTCLAPHCGGNAGMHADSRCEKKLYFVLDLAVNLSRKVPLRRLVSLFVHFERHNAHPKSTNTKKTLRHANFFENLARTFSCFPVA